MLTVTQQWLETVFGCADLKMEPVLMRSWITSCCLNVPMNANNTSCNVRVALFQTQKHTHLDHKENGRRHSDCYISYYAQNTHTRLIKQLRTTLLNYLPDAATTVSTKKWVKVDLDTLLSHSCHALQTAHVILFVKLELIHCACNRFTYANVFTVVPSQPWS